jgi:hypothetical protein
MVETSDEIRRELAITREHMGDTLAELERKLNPRNAVQNYPLATLGVAFGTGVMLGIRGGNGTRSTNGRIPSRNGRMHAEQPAPSMLDELMEGARAALIGAGTVKLSHFLESLMHHATKSLPQTNATSANISRSTDVAPSQPTQPVSGRRW